MRLVFVALCLIVLATAVADARAVRRHHAKKRQQYTAAQINHNAFPVLAGGDLQAKYIARFTDTNPGIQPVVFTLAVTRDVLFRFSTVQGVQQVSFRLPSAEAIQSGSSESDQQCLAGNVATINGVTSAHLAWIRGADNGQITCPDIPGNTLMAFYDGVAQGFGATSSDLVDGMQVNCVGVGGRKDMYYKILKPIQDVNGGSFYTRYNYALAPHGDCTVQAVTAARDKLHTITLKKVVESEAWVKNIVDESTNDYNAVKDGAFATWFGRYGNLQRGEADADKKKVMCDKVFKMYELFSKTAEAKLGAQIATAVALVQRCAGMSRNYP